MCWIYTQRGSCPRGNKCNFAHSEAELNQSKARQINHINHSSQRQSMPPGGPSSKDDFFMLDQFGGKKPMAGGGGHMQVGETSPMRFPGGGGGPGGGPPQMNLSKVSPLPPQNNNLLMPQPYNGDMMMPMGGGSGISPAPPPVMNHHGPPHHHGPMQHHHQAHSPLHVPTGPYSGGPPSSLHPYHNAGGGGGAGPYNSMLPPTPNQLSPLGKFGFDPTKFNPNIRVSPNLGGQQGPPLPPPPPPVMPHPGRSPRHYPSHGPPQNNNNKSGGSGGGFSQNHMFMGEMMGAGQMVGNKPPSQNITDFGGGNNTGDFLSVQQQQQVKNASNFYWRKPINQQMMQPGSPHQQQQQQQQNMNMNKSPSHMSVVGGSQMGKGLSPHGPSMGGNPMNKPGGAYPGGMQGGGGASLNDIMSPRQPPKNSPTYFGKDDMPYWSQQAQQMAPNGDSMHQQQRDAQRNQVMTGNGGGPSHLPHLYGEPPGAVGPPPVSSNNSRRMFDRSDSILAGEDAPFEGNATTSKFGPIQRKASNSLGTGDTLKSSMAGLDLRHQAWLNSSQAGGSSQTSPRMTAIGHQVPIGSEKKLSPSKELGLAVSSSGHQHLVSVIV